MRTVIEYGPDTPEEIELKRLLAEMQERWKREAQPILDRLAQLQSYKTPSIWVVSE